MLARFCPDTKIKALTMGFNDEKDETKEAQELARKYNIPCQTIIKEDILSDLEKIMPVVKEPRWNVYPYYIYERCKGVVYTGDGGDECWAGYTWRYKALQYSLCGFWDYLHTNANDWVPDQPELLPNFTFIDDVLPLTRNNFDDIGLTNVFMADFNGKLIHDYLWTDYCYSQHFGIDIRSLFMAEDMVHIATHTPWQLKWDGKYGKLPLQNILGIRKEQKRGFGPHLRTLWERQGKELYNQYVHQGSRIVKDGLINGDWIKKHREPESDRYINKMLQLVALEIWQRQQA